MIYYVLGGSLNLSHLFSTVTKRLAGKTSPIIYFVSKGVSLFEELFIVNKCKKLNSLEQCLTATRPTSHN